MCHPRLDFDNGVNFTVDLSSSGWDRISLPRQISTRVVTITPVKVDLLAFGGVAELQLFGCTNQNYRGEKAAGNSVTPEWSCCSGPP